MIFVLNVRKYDHTKHHKSQITHNENYTFCGQQKRHPALFFQIKVFRITPSKIARFSQLLVFIYPRIFVTTQL